MDAQTAAGVSAHVSAVAQARTTPVDGTAALALIRAVGVRPLLLRPSPCLLQHPEGQDCVSGLGRLAPCLMQPPEGQDWDSGLAPCHTLPEPIWLRFLSSWKLLGHSHKPTCFFVPHWQNRYLKHAVCEAAIRATD